MSYCVSAIAVDLDKVKAAIGSKNKKLFAALSKEAASDLEQIEEMIADHLEDDEDEDGNPLEPFSAEEALRGLIMGGERREEFGFAYGYCFEYLCLHFGEFLNNSHWSAMRSEWFETVAKGLVKAGVTTKMFSLNELFFRGPPVELPEVADFPSIGYLTRPEIAKARDVLAKADLTKVKDRGVVESVEQIRSWLDECVQSKRDLVCTYA
jgi:hypothetical protein